MERGTVTDHAERHEPHKIVDGEEVGMTMHPLNAGARTLQELADKGLNPFAITLLVESVTKSRTLEAIPRGVSFSLNTDDPRHKGVQITITKAEP
jgi:hypothetical protein